MQYQGAKESSSGFPEHPLLPGNRFGSFWSRSGRSRSRTHDCSRPVFGLDGGSLFSIVKIDFKTIFLSLEANTILQDLAYLIFPNLVSNSNRYGLLLSFLESACPDRRSLQIDNPRRW